MVAKGADFSTDLSSPHYIVRGSMEIGIYEQHGEVHQQSRYQYAS